VLGHLSQFGPTLYNFCLCRRKGVGDLKARLTAPRAYLAHPLGRVVRLPEPAQDIDQAYLRRVVNHLTRLGVARAPAATRATRTKVGFDLQHYVLKIVVRCTAAAGSAQASSARTGGSAPAGLFVRGIGGVAARVTNSRRVNSTPR
jgi:hypothetical protein